ncbi:MAG: hypothetical protein RLZZ607_430 [Pseudomonadota bacterium]|jgi:hypothetical protein
MVPCLRGAKMMRPLTLGGPIPPFQDADDKIL